MKPSPEKRRRSAAATALSSKATATACASLFVRSTILFLNIQHPQADEAACSKGNSQAYRSFCFRAEEYNVAVGRYVIMPDHVHLSSQCLNREHAVGVGSHAPDGSRKTTPQTGNSEAALAGGFFDHVLRNAESYREEGVCVENPVRADL